MSDIREFPMQPPADDTPEEMEIRPLHVWPFLEAQWARERQRQLEERVEQAISDWLRGTKHE